LHDGVSLFSLQSGCELRGMDRYFGEAMSRSAS